MSTHADTPRYPRWSKPAAAKTERPRPGDKRTWPRLTPKLRRFPRR
jgi:hypothetical protein